MSAVADLVKPSLSKIRVPSPGDKIYKDECVYSFDTPESDNGLYVCMNTFLGLGRDYVERYFRKSGNGVFLHIKRYKKEVPQDKGGNNEGPEKKITRLAIGVEGGFNPDTVKKYEYEEHFSVVVLPDFVETSLPNPDLPERVQLAAATLIASDSASKLDEIQALNATWDGELRKISKHAEGLIQINNGRKIPPRGWKCEDCEMTENLWLNLTDGCILCGRRFFDGSGGNNHALEHFQTTAYPLAVKLGTITPDGKADVYSYDEDDMVEDPKLVQHLAHFGINISQMEKTDKSMAELEIDMNQRVGEWATLQEAGCHLKPVFGPGYTGLANLGNSCYLNSVMQVLFTIPDFQRRFVDGAETIFDGQGGDPVGDFNVQMAKLGTGLLSGKYSTPPADGTGIDLDANDSQPGVSPKRFRTLIGKDHPEFSTKKQQDAQEFLLHLINVVERNSRHQSNPADCFKFRVEDRVQCTKSGKVKYAHRTESSLPLPIPLEAATNKDEVSAYEKRKADAESKGQRLNPDQLVRPRITLDACLESFAEPETIEFFSTAVNERTLAKKTTRLASFPDYLMIQLKKFTVGDDWQPKKLDVAVEMPEVMDITMLRAQGMQAGETELPDVPAQGQGQGQQPSQVMLDMGIVQQLMDMGFNGEACKKAAFMTSGGGVEEATNWLMQHLDDADINEPFQHGSASGGGGKNAFQPDEGAVATIMAMGFTRSQAVKALKNTENAIERAVDWIFSHQDELDKEDAPSDAPPVPDGPHYRDGPGRYKLQAFISHMGTSTMVGHYVCHIFRDGHWVIYNDNKVALSENPPKDLGYLYLYRRM